MTEILDDQLLEGFIHEFYGYGNYAGTYWFIGMEEGGGNKFKEIADRLNAWQKMGKHELEDLEKYHVEIRRPYYFNDQAKLQPTWNKLIRILLSSKNSVLKIEKEEVREYQKMLLGRLNGETCLVELLPLPSPSRNRWFYAQHSRLPYLTTREKYEQTLYPDRISHLRQRINEYKPKVVIFYGSGYREYWKSIAKIDFSESHGISIGRSESTLFIITKHPSTKGITNEYFHQVGKIIKEVRGCSWDTISNSLVPTGGCSSKAPPELRN